jgi:hypothetical protein
MLKIINLFWQVLKNLPMHEGPLSIHEIKLVVQPSPGLSNSSGVGEHADSSLDLGKITPRYYGRRLVVDPNLEPCRTPVYKLDGALGLDGRYGGIYILGDNISTVQHAASHVLAWKENTVEDEIQGKATTYQL